MNMCVRGHPTGGQLRNLFRSDSIHADALQAQTVMTVMQHSFRFSTQRGNARQRVKKVPGGRDLTDLLHDFAIAHGAVR